MEQRVSFILPLTAHEELDIAGSQEVRGLNKNRLEGLKDTRMRRDCLGISGSH